MGATRGAAADAAAAATHLAILPNEVHHVKGIPWKRIVRLVASGLWFWITTSLAFLIRFTTRRVFRIGREEDSSRHSNDSNCESTRLLEKLIEASKSQEEDSDASKETSVFQFRFSFQVPEESTSSREVRGGTPGEDMGSVPSVRTSVSSYRFLFERDFRGFVEAPQAMTMCVQESFMGSGVVLENSEELDGELRSRFSSVKCFPQANSGDEEVGHGGEEAEKSLCSDIVALGNSEELDMELSIRFASVKSSGRVRDAGTEDASHQSLDSDGIFPANDAEEVDRELKTRLSLVKLPRQDYSSTGGAVGGDGEVCMNLYSGVVLENMNNTEELDRELTTRFLSVKGSNLDIGPAVLHGDGVGKSLVHPDSLSKTEESAEWEPAIQFRDQRNQLDVFSFPGELDEPVGADLPSAWVSHLVDSDSESESSSDGYSVKDFNLDFDSDGFLSERDFEQETEKGHLLNLDGEGEESLCGHQRYEEAQFPNAQDTDDGNSADYGMKNEEFVEDLNPFIDIDLEILHNSLSRSAIHDEALPDGEVELNPSEEAGTSNSKPSDIIGEENGTVSESSSTETNQSQNSQAPESLVNAVLLGKNSDGKEHGCEDSHEESHSQEGPQNSEETDVSKLKELSLEESEELESLWEHQDLIDQLRMELRKVRSVGLPTILEESESPKSIEDLKPWMFDAKFLHENPMDELHKFYKSYRERMRKFDILNYQKMYAMGFLQLKDPLESMGTQKPLIPAITALLSQNIWPRRRRCDTDPSEKFVRELQSDLETVYVGQSCLSWEFLRWQYEKTRELVEPDPIESHQYNQVAGEFQQFQVLVQRFLEDEPFHGPRVPNYVKNRCILRSLLQVPVIREDCLKDKMEERSKGKDAITSEQLEYIMEESIRVFWEFVRADRDDTPVIVKGLIGSHFELQDPEDIELMVDIQSALQKKEKKLKDIVRTGNCLVKKFKKPREGRPNLDDVFFSQVDLKLVSRVLRMTRITTDQLVWCHKKLSKIIFVDRKLVREPLFLLFPC